jgi:GT2 family glycosyltransferase
VDNGSDYLFFKNLKEDLKSYEEDLNINLIRIKRNIYFVGANNKAISASKGDYICLLNNDTVVQPNFIEAMVEFLTIHPEAGFICPKIKVYKNKNYIWYAGSNVNLKQRKVISIKGQWEFDPDNEKYCSTGETDFAAGTAAFFRRSLVEKIGLMDEVFMFYHEDPDWSLRARRIGSINYYVPATIVFHKVSKRINEKRVILNNFFYMRNSQILVWKHGSILDLIIFYLKFISVNLKELITYFTLAYLPLKISEFLTRSYVINHENKRNYKFIFNLHINAIIRGFIVGLRRKLHVSCKNNMKKDYYFIKYSEKIIQLMNIKNLHIFQDF